MYELLDDYRFIILIFMEIFKMHVTKCICPVRHLKKQILVAALKNYLKQASTNLIKNIWKKN